ncbi:hypothetical protein BKA83DRAFT_4125852 [Pisolithus microcarpus]|nr:hypothetical protein BKA83DRAFT_4125852 [Pisolithus microcarpus]
MPSMTKFYHSHIHPLKNALALQTFQEWLAAGVKFGQITARGLVYLLLLSGLGLQLVVGRVHGLVHSNVATMLRSPQTAEPAQMQEELPLLIEIGGTLLDCTSLKESDHVLGSLNTFAKIGNFRELQLPPRSSSAWQPCSPLLSEDGQYISISKAISNYLNHSTAGAAISPWPSQSTATDIHPHPALPDPTPLNVTVIKTHYSHFHTLNTWFPHQQNH